MIERDDEALGLIAVEDLPTDGGVDLGRALGVHVVGEALDDLLDRGGSDLAREQLAQGLLRRLGDDLRDGLRLEPASRDRRSDLTPGLRVELRHPETSLADKSYGTVG